MASISCYVNTLPVTTAADQIGTETEHSGREKVRCPKSYVRCTGCGAYFFTKCRPL